MLRNVLRPEASEEGMTAPVWGRTSGRFWLYKPRRRGGTGLANEAGVHFREGEAPAEPPAPARQEPRPPQKGHYRIEA